MNPEYTICLLIGILCGGLVAQKLRMPKPKNNISSNIYIVLALGVIIGAKIPILLSYGLASALVIANKSVMGALLGAFIAINLYKYFLHQQGNSYGGIFIIPLAVAIGFGKIGCYLNGCCGGHFIIPIQLAESAFQFMAAGALYWFYCHTKRIDLLFPLYMLGYLIMRFAAEFVRTEPRIWLNLTAYQWSALIFIPIFAYILWRRINVGTIANNC